MKTEYFLHNQKIYRLNRKMEREYIELIKKTPRTVYEVICDAQTIYTYRRKRLDALAMMCIEAGKKAFSNA